MTKIDLRRGDFEGMHPKAKLFGFDEDKKLYTGDGVESINHQWTTWCACIGMLHWRWSQPMTEIQQTNIAVANFIIDELHKEKPFNLVLDAGQTGALYNITSESHHLHSGFVRKLEATLRQRVRNGTGVILEINCNADLYYHVLSSYIAGHQKPANSIDQFIQSGEFDKAFRDVFGLPIGVVRSLGEVT